MAYKLILPEPKKTKESFGGKVLRNVTGGLVNAAENAENFLKMGASAVANPLGINPFIPQPHGKAGSRLGAEAALGQEYLKPKNASESYGQHLAGALPLAVAGGGGFGTGLKEGLKNVGKAASHIIKSDIGRGTAQAAGFGEVGQTIAGALAPGVIESLKPSSIQKHYQPIKKELYNKVKTEGNTKVAAGEIKDLTKDFLETEQRRSGGKSPYIRKLAHWNKEASNNEIKAVDLHNIKKDLNQYIYKEYGSPDYLKALEKEVHAQIDAAGKSPRTETNLTLPSWSKNLKKADKLHGILTKGEWDKSPAVVKWLFNKFTPGKMISYAGKNFVTPAKLWTALPQETLDFYVKNILEGIEKNPSHFQTDIKKLNHLLEKEEPKKAKFKLVL